jgi:hypothetical protein
VCVCAPPLHQFNRGDCSPHFSNKGSNSDLELVFTDNHIMSVADWLSISDDLNDLEFQKNDQTTKLNLVQSCLFRSLNVL